jgi:integrase
MRGTASGGTGLTADNKLVADAVRFRPWAPPPPFRTSSNVHPSAPNPLLRYTLPTNTVWWRPATAVIPWGYGRGVSFAVGVRGVTSGPPGGEILLTDSAIRNAKPQAKAFKLFDERGLFLLVSPTGGKLWRFKYRFGGTEKLLSLGKYPDVSLAKARERRDAARRQVADGVDPSLQRRETKLAAGDTFETIARDWLEKYRSKWTPLTAETKLRRLELHVFPKIGSRRIRELTAAEILPVLRRVEAGGKNDTARRVHQLVSEVFRFAIATGRAESDVSRDLRGALAPAQVKHRAAPDEPASKAGLRKVAELLRMYGDYEGFIVTRCALRLMPLVFARPGELRQMEWSEVDLDDAVWTIPASKMKMRSAHVVPLSRQAVAIIREIQPVTGDGRYVFPSARASDRPMSDNAILAAMRRMGIAKEEMTGHGWRAVARTILDEVLGFRVDIIEHQLAHAVIDANGRAYNRTSFLSERAEMMQRWADYLDKLKGLNR